MQKGNAMKFIATFFLASTVFAAGSVPQTALAADSWFACKGTVSTIPAKSSKPANVTASERVIALNDDIKRIYQWMEPRKQLSPMAETSYTDKEITWDTSDRATSGPHWAGKLDRTKMALTIEYTEGDLSRMLWIETCAPTQPRDNAEASTANAATGGESTKAN